MKQPDSTILLQTYANSMDAIILTDEHLAVKLMNPAAERMFGCIASEMFDTQLTQLIPSISFQDLPAQIPTDGLDENGASNARQFDDLTAIRADGATLLIRANITRLREIGDAGYMLFLRDMTETVAVRNRLQRLATLYAARSQFRQATRQTVGRQEMLAAACHALVTHSGFRMAWIGWHMPETVALVIVAESGDDTGYLKGLEVFVDDRPNGQGPSGMAFRKGRPVVVGDLLHEAKYLPWHDKAKAAGLRSSAAFPIRMHGEVCGTLNVYSDAVGFFQAEEIALLTEAADDLSSSLDGFAHLERWDNAEALARRERQFSDAIVESMPGICYLYTEPGRFLRWNKNFEAVSGYGPEEIAAMQPQDFFPAEDQALLLPSISKVFKDGEATMEGTFLSKDGTRTAYFFTGRRVMFHGMRCLLGVGIDISSMHLAQIALAESEMRYRTTLDSILEAGQLIGFDWRYKYLNDAASKQNRRPKESMLGRTIQEVWPGIEETHAFRLIKTCMEQRIAVHEEIEFTFAEGDSSWFDLRIQPVPEGAFLLSIDVTERRLAEDKLHALNTDLENRILQRTEELKSAMERAEASDRTKSVFLATMSHELRTPLNSIIGFTGIMVQGLAGPLNPEQSKQLGMVQSSARHLLSLVNDVLDISKIEAGEMEVYLQPFDIKPSIEMVVASVAGMAERKGLSLDLVWNCQPFILLSDKRRFEQILLNLINNAVKFTETGGVTVQVDLYGPGQQPTDLRIVVLDTGIGIRPEDLQTLFVPFRQIDSGMTRQHDGTGLGLAICRRLLDYLGGKIQVQSEYGAGSAFTVTLPLKAKVY